MRHHTKEEVVYNRFWGRHEKVTTLAPGLKTVHIGTDVWLFGKQSHVKGLSHMVIYAPDRKTEHHVWGVSVDQMIPKMETEEYYRANRHGNYADEAKVKIYILTAILDVHTNWCFDLSKVPPNGRLKVIYDNGTVKNIDFLAPFSAATIGKKYSKRVIRPVGYRKN